MIKLWKNLTFSGKVVLTAMTIMCIIIIVCAFVKQPQTQKIDRHDCEIIQTENILTQVDKSVCEIIDVKGDIIECFYGQFDYVNEDTYGKVWYYEKDFAKIYYVLPGGTIKIYQLKDEE